MPDQDNNVGKQYEHLNPKHPAVEKFYPILELLEDFNFKSRNVIIHSDIKALSDNSNITFLYHSNHEGHADYVIQQIELERAGIKLPLVGARDKLHDDLLKNRSLKNRAALPIYEHHSYNIPKGDGRDILNKMIEIEKLLLNEGSSILKYPGGGISKNGRPREFGRLSYKVPVDYLLSLMEEAKENSNIIVPNVYIIPSSISQEIVPDFDYYGDEHASPNPDDGRWKEIGNHFLKGEKGDVNLAFNKPILVNAYLGKDMAQKDIENTLKEISWNSAMSSIPLQSTDIVALATVYSILGENVLLAFSGNKGKTGEILVSLPKETNGNFRENKKNIYRNLIQDTIYVSKEDILNSIEKLVYLAHKEKVFLSDEARNYSSDEMAQRVYYLFSGKEKNAFIEPKEGKHYLTNNYDLIRGNLYALLMYANRAMFKIKHHMEHKKNIKLT